MVMFVDLLKLLPLAGYHTVRLLEVYDIISLTLDSIQHNVDFDAEDRARASGLLISMLSRETLTTLFFMDV